MTISVPVHVRSRRAAAALGAVLALTSLAACSGGEDDQEQGAQEAAQDLAAGLAAADLADVPFTEGTPQEVTDDYAATVAGLGDLGDLEPTVEVTSVTQDAESDARAEATLSWTWAIGPDGWTYQAPVSLVRDEEGSEGSGTWEVEWAHSVVEPTLAPEEVLDLSTLEATRGDVLGAGGQALVTERPVVRVGIDKTRISPAVAKRSATALARLADVDPGAYRRAVTAAGDQAYVEALTYRAEEVPAAVRSGSRDIDGALLVPDERSLAPTRTFAAPLLGTVGEVTAEMVADDPARYRPGDVAGLSGLQARYDDQLRGTPGAVVSAVDPDGQERELDRSMPTPGEDLALSLDPAQQTLAERILSPVGPASAIVALRASTGEILAAANGPGNGGQNLATFGQYAPGSTFKAVTSLALLRAGLTPDSSVSCPATVTVDGRVFGNYSDYPSGGTGTIPLRTAVANSCNTAFISSRDRLDEGALAGAAAALGLGVDHDLGFPAYLGEVPAPTSETGRAADTIGQGTVLASPMAMATVIASVQQGSTVVPSLVEAMTDEPPADLTPLTPTEAEQLQAMLRGVVTEGSGSVLADVPGGPVIAKTGTAEFQAADGSTRTHAWMIAAHDDLAVAVFVDEGASGSSTAGPLLAEFLQTAR